MRDNSNPGSLEHFAKKIDVTATCWWWTDWRSAAGYGGYKIGKQKWAAHRLMWTIVNGPIPKGLVIRHMCRNPACVNPDHLAIGTQKDNMHDAMADGTHGGLVKRARSLAKTEEERRADQARHARRYYARRDEPKDPKGYRRGENAVGAKLTADAIRAIRTRHADGASRFDLAREYGVTHQHIHAIIKRHTWRHVD